MHQGITLKNGVEMPLLGFGVFRLKEERISCIRTAVETGYRLFDTAAACQDEQAVGTALRQAVESVPCDRAVREAVSALLQEQF